MEQKYSKMKTKNKILVTGGCGYIGSHTVVSLLENDLAKEKLGWRAKRKLEEMISS